MSVVPGYTNILSILHCTSILLKIQGNILAVVKISVNRSHIRSIGALEIPHTFTLEVFFNIADTLKANPAARISASVFPDRVFSQQKSSYVLEGFPSSHNCLNYLVFLQLMPKRNKPSPTSQLGGMQAASLLLPTRKAGTPSPGAFFQRSGGRGRRPAAGLPRRIRRRPPQPQRCCAQCPRSHC